MNASTTRVGETGDHRRGQRVFLGALALISVFVAICLLPAPQTGRSDAGEPTSTPTAVPPVGQLAPEHPTYTELEDTPEVRSLRAAFAAVTWASLYLNCEFPEFHDGVRPGDRHLLCPRSDLPRADDSLDRVRPVGPPAFEPIEVIRDEDGTAIVMVCLREPQLSYDSITHRPFDAGPVRHRQVGWRLAPSAPDSDSLEFQLMATGPRTFAASCEPKFPITVQRFEDWQDTPVFTLQHANEQLETASLDQMSPGKVN
ncbi:hypothetical protein [Cellulomonas sp. Y8]|uniref:hypothetical protein n=1 Tax=Cellulomonas sp. Y8 TaxID=2591145 RepID=UPI003D7387F3